jgi:TPR repeat protein
VSSHYNLGILKQKLGNQVEARCHFERAAELGDVDAEYELAISFEADVQRLERSANNGCVKAAHRLGFLHQLGDGVEQSFAKAVDYHRSAADRGCADAQGELGWLLEKGLGAKRDLGEAAFYYRLAADKNDVFANYRLGRLLEAESAEPLFTRVKELLDSEQKLSAWHWSLLAEMHIKGRGFPKNPELGVQLLIDHALEDGEPVETRAHLLIAQLSPHSAEAEQCLRLSIKCAERDNLLYDAAKGKYHLGKLLANKGSPEEAQELLEVALAAGYRKAAVALAELPRPLCYGDALCEFIDAIGSA